MKRRNVEGRKEGGETKTEPKIHARQTCICAQSPRVPFSIPNLLPRVCAVRRGPAMTPWRATRRQGEGCEVVLPWIALYSPTPSLFSSHSSFHHSTFSFPYSILHSLTLNNNTAPCCNVLLHPRTQGRPRRRQTPLHCRR